MKELLSTKIMIALAVTVAVVAAVVIEAQEQPIPPPSASPTTTASTDPSPSPVTPPQSDTASPAPAPSSGDTATAPDIIPGSPLADVVKMIQAGIDPGTVEAYVQNSQGAFNLDADKILYLKDLGAPSDVINSMMDRDKALYASSVTPPPAPPTPVPAPTPPPTVDTPPPVVDNPPPDAPPEDTAPPATDVSVNYFYDTLTPYGSWVDVEGYGRCWRPTVVNYDTAWSPYCDRGHWVYTDYGWYWDSDYAWGSTFHYGRWFHHARFGWCWYPDTVWAPSWVAWRSGGDYCGWAPLPPFAEFRPGFGFFYRGAHVGVDFDFGLAANCFVFVSPEHFCDRRPRSFCVPHDRVDVAFRQTTVVNHFDEHNQRVVNRGFGPDRIAAATHHPIEPVHVGALPNAPRQGWRGDSHDQGRDSHQTAGGHFPPQGNNQSHNFDNGISHNGNTQGRQGSDWRNGPGAGANTGHNENQFQNSQGTQTGAHGQPTGFNHEQTSTQPHPINNNYNSTGTGHPVTQNQWQQGQQQTSPIQTSHPGPQQQFPQTQQQPRQFGTLTEPSHTVPQNRWQQPQQPQQHPVVPQPGYAGIQNWQQQQQSRQYNSVQPNQYGQPNPWQQPQQAHQYTPPNQNPWQQPNQWQQNRTVNPQPNESVQQHYAPPPEPVHQAPPEPQHNYSPPPQPQPQSSSQGQSQSHGGGGSNSGNNNGNNKQNH